MNLVRVAAVVLIASATGACSSVPDWMNPFGDDTPAADPGPAPMADNGSTPDLANVPDRPVQTSTPDSQRQVAQSLAADGAQSRYSTETLRAGGETAAAPPPPPSAVSTTVADATPAPAAPSPAPAAADDTPPPDAPQTIDTTTTADAAPPPPMAAAPVRPTRMASANVPSMAANVPPPMSAGDGRPAVPPGPAMRSVPGAQPAMSDSALGFRASTAPPLDASVAQFVAPAIMSRYRQTSGSNVAVASNAVPATASRRGRRGAAMGGPEQMSGSVVADLGSLSSVPAAGGSASSYGGTTGVAPSSVVFFPGDTTILTASAKAQVRAAVQAYTSRGGSGFIRVVGHASSRTGNMPLERHLVVIFEKSQQRANSVAQELIREGVPASKVLVEAVGDSQPVYYESMPKGEDGNRRAEIFLQS